MNPRGLGTSRESLCNRSLKQPLLPLRERGVLYFRRTEVGEKPVDDQVGLGKCSKQNTHLVARPHALPAHPGVHFHMNLERSRIGEPANLLSRPQNGRQLKLANHGNVFREKAAHDQDAWRGAYGGADACPFTRARHAQPPGSGFHQQRRAQLRTVAIRIGLDDGEHLRGGPGGSLEDMKIVLQVGPGNLDPVVHAGSMVAAAMQEIRYCIFCTTTPSGNFSTKLSSSIFSFSFSVAMVIFRLYSSMGRVMEMLIGKSISPNFW